jgi:NAD(P)-dependent dehydrogenase (short-subunit alcohol dehydrogenase family)
MYDFTGDVALVTGGASGIGRAIAERLAREGAAVGIADVDDIGLKSTVEELVGQGCNAHGVKTDVSHPPDVENAVSEIESALGPVSLLVNNAGIAVIKRYVEHSDEDFDRQLRVNLVGTHLFLSRVLPGMLERGTGAVVNIASAAAIRYTTPHAGYAASKAGIIALTRDVAFEVASAGVRVNCVAPGLIAVPPSATKTPFLQSSAEARDLDKSTSTRPVGWGRPEDIANAVAFLLSDQARFIIGQTLSVTGGTDLQITMGFPGE